MNGLEQYELPPLPEHPITIADCICADDGVTLYNDPWCRVHRTNW